MNISIQRVTIKICGLTRSEDLAGLAGLGIDFAGFVFAPRSPRFVSPERAAELKSLVPAGIKKVGVFVNEERKTVERLARAAALDLLQFHGSESAGFCRSFGLPFFKAFPVTGPFDWRAAARYRPGRILLDAFSPARAGGTGVRFNWELAGGDRSGMDLILAGGLNPDNVGEAVRRIKPWGVDVSTGVESAPGVKDIEKIRRFVEAVRAR